MKPAFVFFMTITMASVQLAAQTSNDKTMDEMLDKGKKSKETFILKFNPITILNGDFPLYAEVRLSRKFSLEAGVGFMTSYYIRELIYIVQSKQPFEIEPDGELDVKGGFSLRLFPKYFFIGDNLQGLAVGVFWRQRQYGIQNSDEKVRFNDLCLMYTQQSALGNSRIFFEYYLGIGIRKPQFPEGVVPVNGNNQLIMPWGLKVGYAF